MERLGDARGQATTEYVGLVALVAVALALASGLTSGGVGGQVLAGLQRGLCGVAPVGCPRPEPPRADLAACPLEQHARTEELATTIAVLRLGTSGTLALARASDGRMTVTLAHGSTVGGESGLGARLRVGRRAVAAEAEARAGIAWTSGRSWSFADEATARRFVATYGRKATIGGQLLDGVRSRCSVLCDALGWRPHAELPEPDAIYAEAGPIARLSASLGLGTRAEADAGALLGRRLGRTGERTWYLRLGAVATAALGLPGGELTAGAGHDAVLAYELDARGIPHTLRVSTAVELRDGAAATGTLGSRRAALAAGEGTVVELEATLDLREAVIREAAAGLVDALTGPDATALVRRARTLGGQIVRRGQVDLRVYASARTSTGLGAGVAFGAKLDGELERATSGLRLIRAETRLPGLPFLPRDDCRAG